MMRTQWVFVDGLQEIKQTLDPQAIFIGHEYFGKDVSKRSDYRLPFLDALQQQNYQPIFPDIAGRPGTFMPVLAQHLLNAAGAIFDVSTFNANVLIELGLAIALNRPVLVIADAAVATLPDWLEELAPLRFASSVKLARSVIPALEARLTQSRQQHLDHRLCVACQEDCPCRETMPIEREGYMQIGIDAEADEALDYHVETTIKQFQLSRVEEMASGNLAVCRWLSHLRATRIALFHLEQPHHEEKDAARYLQLGLAAGSGTPWTMILPPDEPPPVDVAGQLYVEFGASPLVFRSALTNVIKGLLLTTTPTLDRINEVLPLVPLYEEDMTEDLLEDEKEIQEFHWYEQLNLYNSTPIDKFTERFRRVMILSLREALRLNHNYIGTEHLLLGLIREGEGAGIQVLNSLGVQLRQIRSAVEFIVDRKDERGLGTITLTPRAKKIIELAIDEARRLNQNYVGTEHLLIGFVREGEGIAAGVLESLGVNLEKARTATIQVLANEKLDLATQTPPYSQIPSSPNPISSSPNWGSRSSNPVNPSPREQYDRLDRFTESARRILSLAQEEAQRFNHHYIGSEHLVLGMIRENDGVAAQTLITLGVDLVKVRSAVEFIIGRGDRIVLGEISLTPRAKKIVELAADEARRLNHHYVGTESLLLGLVHEGEGIGAGVLESLGVSLEKVRITVIQILSKNS